MTGLKRKGHRPAMRATTTINEKRSGTRGLMFALLSSLSLFIYSPYLLEVYGLSRENELMSHVPLIPLFSAYLMYSNRKEIFSQTGFSAAGVLLALAGAAISVPARFADLGEADLLSVMVLSWTVFLAGSFTAVFGSSAGKKAAFPLAFMIFMVPLPQALIDGATEFLQRWSAETAWWIFNLVGAPVQKEGFFFHLPGLNVEVARQCSGIRSSMALVIAGVLASSLFLRTWPARGALLAAVVPIAVLKNGLRIAALTLSGYYIDERMLYGSLHTRGGMLFFAIALLMAGAAVWGLRAAERRFNKKNAAGTMGPRGA